jgi:LysM repeat protein
MRTALVSILFLALALGVQSILPPASENPGEPAMVIAPAPTPSAFPTMTRATQQDCEATPYTVEAGDTLEGLAIKFSVSEAELVRHNQLPTQLLRAGMVLEIPVCRSTPTGTIIATLFTRTQISVTGGAPSATGTGQ